MGGAVSSVVEHFLDTEGVRGSNPLSRTIPDNLSKISLIPAFHGGVFEGFSGARPNSSPNTSRYTRVEKGLFRYRKTGQIWSVQRRGRKVRWTNLKTTGLEMARAKLQTWPWKQAQKVIDYYVKEYQIDEPQDPRHPTAAPATPAKGIEEHMRIPMKADTCSNPYRTPFRACRTVVGAKRRSVGVINRCPTGVKVLPPVSC